MCVFVLVSMRKKGKEREMGGAGELDENQRVVGYVQRERERGRENYATPPAPPKKKKTKSKKNLTTAMEKNKTNKNKRQKNIAKKAQEKSYYDRACATLCICRCIVYACVQ